MWKRLLLVVALASAAVLVACNRDQSASATDEPAQPFVRYESEELGLAVEHPPDWVTHVGFNGLTVASDRLVIDSNSLGEIGQEAFVTIIPGELAVFGLQAGETFEPDRPDAVLQTYRQLLENEGQVYTVVEPLSTSSGEGENAAWMVVSSPVEDQTLVTMLGVVIQGEYVALVSAGALEGQFEDVQPTLQHVVDSIAISPPSDEGR